MLILSFQKAIIDSLSIYIARIIDKKFDSTILKKSFEKKWLFDGKDERYFNFNGAFLPDITKDRKIWECFYDDFPSILFFHCYYNNVYSEENVKKFNHLLGEGVYCLTNNKVDVTIKKGDVVIDAGSFIGEFAAFAASQGAVTYAFEPASYNFNYLVQTAILNDPLIIPIKKGLGSRIEILKLYISSRSGGNTLTDSKLKRFNESVEDTEEIEITTLDDFVKENKIPKVDFIKADIEGFERFMLEGAKETLRTFSPKLSICTYHLPDDPQILEQIIKEANPNYKVIHSASKLFASVSTISQ